MLKTTLGMMLGLMIGFCCRRFEIPLPGPPNMIGAILVVAMTLGYWATDRLILKMQSSNPVSVQSLNISGRAKLTDK